MMSNELTNNHEFNAIEKVLVAGDLSSLNADQRVAYYNKTCESLGLNPLTKPFDYITLKGKLQLYARKDATEQLRKINGISITKLETKKEHDIYIVIAHALDKNGRVDASSGAVSLVGLKGDDLANAFMKAETKAKRRVTLSISGLGLLDESELETIATKDISPKRTETNLLPHKPIMEAEAFDDAMNQIVFSTSIEQLQALGKKIGEYELTPSQREVLKENYKIQQDALKEEEVKKVKEIADEFFNEEA